VSADSHDRDLVFCHPESGHPLDRSKLIRRFKQALDRAEVHQITFHELRHTFGTRMAPAGHTATHAAALDGPFGLKDDAHLRAPFWLVSNFHLAGGVSTLLSQGRVAGVARRRQSALAWVSRSSNGAGKWVGVGPSTCPPDAGVLGSCL
jgi:hypothetical protein